MIKLAFNHLTLRRFLKLANGDMDKTMQLINLYNVVLDEFEGKHLELIMPIKDGVELHFRYLNKVKVLIKCDKDIDSLFKGDVDKKYRKARKNFLHDGKNTLYLLPNSNQPDFIFLNELHIVSHVSSFLNYMAKKQFNKSFHELCAVENPFDPLLEEKY
jgi:hypothetical protein